jgi:hypothetical protein
MAIARFQPNGSGTRGAAVPQQQCHRALGQALKRAPGDQYGLPLRNQQIETAARCLASLIVMRAEWVLLPLVERA